MFNMIEKTQPIRNKAYLKFVKSLPCVISGIEGVDVHHLIGHSQGGMGTKSSDLFVFPLSREEHTHLHDKGWRQWEEMYGSQWEFVALTLSKAISSGVLKL